MINLAQPPAAVVNAPCGGGGGAAITCRLSDGYSWSQSFTVSSPAALMDGCMESWVAFLVEREHRAAMAYPPHQTRNIEKFRTAWPQHLELQMLDDSHPKSTRQWMNANYGTDSSKKIIVRRPGAGNDDWVSGPWQEYFLRVLKCWEACYRLNTFLHGGLSTFLTNNLRDDGEPV